MIRSSDRLSGVPNQLIVRVCENRRGGEIILTRFQFRYLDLRRVEIRERRHDLSAHGGAEEE